MLNSHLSLLSILAVFSSIAGAMYAIYWNLKAAKTHILYTTRLTVAFLAFVYLVTYSVVLFVEIPNTVLVNIFLAMGPVVLFLVFGNPAKHGLETQKRLNDQLLKAVSEKLRQGDDG